jgi:hypothetical protein
MYDKTPKMCYIDDSEGIMTLQEELHMGVQAIELKKQGKLVDSHSQFRLVIFCSPCENPFQ